MPSYGLCNEHLLRQSCAECNVQRVLQQPCIVNFTSAMSHVTLYKQYGVPPCKTYKARSLGIQSRRIAQPESIDPAPPYPAPPVLAVDEVVPA